MRRLFLAIAGVALTGWAAVADPPDVPPPAPAGPPPGLSRPGYGPSGYDLPTAQQFKELVPGLIDALKDPDASVRQHSAMALAAPRPRRHQIACGSHSRSECGKAGRGGLCLWPDGLSSSRGNSRLADRVEG